MMKPLSKGWIVSMMLSSILLLIVFQTLWLRSAWYRAKDDLKKETSLVLRSTVMTLHDTVLMRSVERVPGDTLARRFFRVRPPMDSLSFEDHEPDSSRRRVFMGDVARIQVMVSSADADSLPPQVRPIVTAMSRSRRQGNFILRLKGDTLSLDSIRYHFRSALVNSNLDLPFQVIHFKRGDRAADAATGFVTESIRINPINRYAAIFPDVTRKLVQEVAPQVLFSLFLLLLTSGSFYVMYKNLAAHRRMAELKNDFISNITHELKTPITTVGVALEALRNFNGLDNPKLTREYLDIAQNELNRLAILTDKVLKTAVFEKNGVTFQSEKIDLDHLVTSVLGSMKLVFDRTGVEVTQERNGIDFSVYGAADHLTNIIYNLIDNALKYSSDKPRIRVTLKDLTDRTVLIVEDNGLGIAPVYHKKIFEKFFRVPTGDVHNIKGYGLGLSYVADVVNRHHGTIHVESESGQGSRFVVTLPRNEKD